MQNDLIGSATSRQVDVTGAVTWVTYTMADSTELVGDDVPDSEEWSQSEL